MTTWERGRVRSATEGLFVGGADCGPLRSEAAERFLTAFGMTTVKKDWRLDLGSFDEVDVGDFRRGTV